MINPKYEGEKVAYLGNDFIRYSTALQPLDEVEINLFMYLCYKAKENACVDENGWSKPIEIDMKKFYDGMGYKKTWFDYTKEERKVIYNRLRRLQKETFEIKTPEYIEIVNDVKTCDYEYTSFNYLSRIRYSEHNGVLNIVMDMETQKFLNNYNGSFTPILFKNIITLKNKYAKLLYILFRSYKDGIPQNKGTSYTLEHLRDVLGLNEKYPKWYDFKRYVLIPAIQEINEKSDILIVGKRDVYYDALDGRKPEDIAPDEYAKIVVESMTEKSSRGKAVEKIFFHVLENKNSIIDELQNDALRIETK